MIHRLSAIGLAIDHKTGAFFGAALPRRQFLGLVKEPPQEGLPAFFQFHYIGNVPLGDHQKMYRRLGVHVVKGQKSVVLVEFSARYFSLYDLAEYTVSHGYSVFRNSLYSNELAIFSRSLFRRTGGSHQPGFGTGSPIFTLNSVKNHFAIFSKSFTFANRRLCPKYRGIYSVVPLSRPLLMCPVRARKGRANPFGAGHIPIPGPLSAPSAA
jgi:hypothetical protein